MAEKVGDGIVTSRAWDDELMVAIPIRHPVLAYKHIPIEELSRYPLALGDPAVCEGHALQVGRFLRKNNLEPLIMQHVATFDVMMTLVSAGLALGLAGAAHIASSREPGVVARSLAGKPLMLNTYLLRRDAEPSDILARFVRRVALIDAVHD